MSTPGEDIVSALMGQQETKIAGPWVSLSRWECARHDTEGHVVVRTMRFRTTRKDLRPEGQERRSFIAWRIEAGPTRDLALNRWSNARAMTSATETFGGLLVGECATETGAMLMADRMMRRSGWLLLSREQLFEQGEE